MSTPEFVYWHVRRPLEQLKLAFVWALPRWLVMWCAIRLMAHATQGPWSNQVVPQLTVIDALKRWDVRP